MFIAFSGHRNCTANPGDLEQIAAQYPGATWVHGGAIGFDSQVSDFANSHGIPQQIIKPDYSKFGRPAPLIRNREIINRCDLLVALFDGRPNGGTVYTINFAKHQLKPVHLLTPV